MNSSDIKLFVQEVNRVIIGGKHTRTVGGYINSIKVLRSRGIEVNESEVKTTEQMYELIDKANELKTDPK